MIDVVAAKNVGESFVAGVQRKAAEGGGDAKVIDVVAAKNVGESFVAGVERRAAEGKGDAKVTDVVEAKNKGESFVAGVQRRADEGLGEANIVGAVEAKNKGESFVTGVQRRADEGLGDANIAGAVTEKNKGESFVSEVERRAAEGKGEINIVGDMQSRNTGMSEMDKLLAKHGQRGVARSTGAFKSKSDEQIYQRKLAEKRKKGKAARPAQLHRGGTFNTRSLRVHFGKIDTSGDGLLTFDELYAFLVKSGKRVTKEDTMDMLIEFDENEDGYVDFDEFVEIFKRAPDSLPFGLRMLVEMFSVFSGAVVRSAAGKARLMVATSAAFAAMALAKAIKN